MGNSGTAITFISEEEELQHARFIVKGLRKSRKNVPEELLKMAETFWAIKQRGEGDVPALGWYPRKGRGFDFTKEEKKKFTAKKRATYLGLEEDESDENSEKIRDSDETCNHLEKTEEKPSSIVMWNGAISQKMHVHEKEIVHSNCSDSMSEVMNNVRRFVSDLDIKNQRAQEEIEINDFPQIVRWKITKKKESLQHVMELSGAVIVVKGIFCKPNHKLHMGEKKLYLVIEGEYHMVSIAKTEILRIMEEEMSKGRYNNIKV